ncbi:receptor subunit 1 [Seminavis robusta]|uniref:Receptor subunit 1 n=1 Tax=Seminavis robusta TaxID=568900 RepID=A0A9N8F079_9STRA|nr:receptor subunit 1 [Seminavis robusta]CAB9528994.1 receptor subunit 1 [Seminavis robusta]|eukprot:Sro2372_g325250.1 receptor subunit 1 (649) ;mRNA; r:2839-4785
MTRVRRSSVLLAIVRLFLCFFLVNGFGGEKPAFNATPSSSNHTTSSLRQNVCDRYEKHRAGETELKDALSGLALRPSFVAFENPYFIYNSVEGIASTSPGILAELMDAVAQRANFTWRTSFGVVESPEVYNMTWTELLLWTVENYDISIEWWDHTVERMENGVAYTAPWYDSSYILIDQRRHDSGTYAINLLNWTKPFEPAVWGMIVFTVFFSAIVYQLIEHLNGERDDRSFYQWFSDNVYLSAINFSQNFEYAPSSLAGRIFGVSMTIWALVLTATYTANLASLFVEARVDPVFEDSMEEAVVYGYPVCTFENTNSDFHILETFPRAKRVPRVDEKAMYESLRNGRCALAVTTIDTWLTKQLDEEYNPDCNLEWVGDIIKPNMAGFAVKADVGDKCTSLVRHVVNLHLTALIEEGFLTEAWRRHREQEDGGICEYEEDEQGQWDRRLQSRRNQPTMKPRDGDGPRHRQLKAGGRGAGGSTAEDDDIDAETLTLRQMAGTFIIHYGAMAVAVLVSFLTHYAQKMNWFHREGQVYEKVTNRTNGPVIGMPPRANTFVVRDCKEESARDGVKADSASNVEENCDDSEENCDDSENPRAVVPAEFNYVEMVAKQNALEAKIDRMERALDTQSYMIRQLLHGPRKDKMEHLA